MASSSAYAVLLVCLALCVSLPVQSEEEVGYAGDITTLLEVGDGTPVDIPAAIAMVRSDKNAAAHIKDAEDAYHGAASKSGVSPPEPTAAEQQASDELAAKAEAQKAAAKPPKDNHDATWHCHHCGSSCSTAKCKSWCQQRWCKQNSPMFQDVALRVPPAADNAWHCSHCKGVCKTNKCTNWCKKMWCPMDADGNAFDPNDRNFGRGMRGQKKGRWYKNVKIHGGKGKMELLEISKAGSPKLVAMEQNANKIIALSNKDTTGKLLEAAGNAVEAVLRQRDHEANAFKERETKANEADQKRYSKKRYQKWQDEKDGAEGLAAEEEVAAAKQAVQEDATKEVKFKSQAGESEDATKDLDKKIEKQNKEFEKTADDINKDHATMVSPDQAVFHMKKPSL